jgi:tetratricopeptide (TPR) repeat protein
MAIPVNPYVAGNPVGDSPAFVGRADVLREVVRVLRRPQDNALVLYGQRRIGKTSILQHLAAWLPREGTYRPVYFDLQDKAAWPLGRVLQELVRTIAHALGQPDPDLSPDPETAFRQEWLPAVLGDLPDGSSLVLLFDEFDVLADPKAEQAAAAFFPYLRTLLTSDPGRLQFVFVIGRNVADLTSIALSLFKGTPYQRVTLLSREDTADLVRLSEKNGTLHWPDEAVERVWELTHGHPFLTQQLCSHVWERAYDEEPDEPPTVTAADADAAVPDALEASRNTMEWLWDGLPPAGRVVASALAEAGPGPITQEELERLLHESGVRLVIRELQNAPQLLEDWDLIEPTDGGYRFRVELLRRWIAEHKPLRRVQEELYRIEPVAESLYQAAMGLYRGGQLEQAVALLRQAIALNPNHVGVNQLLADILLAQGQADGARQLLERLYEYQPAAARPRLVQALLAQAQAVSSDDDEQLALYERVLELAPTQPEAMAGQRRIWQQRGDTALKSGDLEAALAAYRMADLTDKVAEIEQEMRRRALTARLQKLETLEQERRYRDALNLAHKLANEYPGIKDWASDLERLERLERMERKTHLADLYQRALGALQGGDRRTAQTLLAQVIALEPGYKEATRYLHLAVTGVDVAELRAQLEAKDKIDKEDTIAARDTSTSAAVSAVQLAGDEHTPSAGFRREGAGVPAVIPGLESIHSGEAKAPVSNPFSYGNPVSPDQFIGRRRELQRIASRIVNQGQSTAIVGEWRSGKTSLLLYLAAPEVQTKLYGARGELLIFSYLDAQTLGGQLSQAQFWAVALDSLYERIIAPKPNSSLAQAYQMCQKDDFNPFVLEHLIAQVGARDWRLVLLLDEFSDLLYHPTLNCAEFFGSLRSLVSRSRGALALVVASRRSLASLSDATQQFSRTGSPYLNFLDEIILGPLSDREIAKLLNRAGDRFTSDDRHFIATVAGGHPFLVQVAASALWEAYEDTEGDPNLRRQLAGQSLYDGAALTLRDIWHRWSPAARKAFAAVALAHINSLEQRESLLEQRAFYVERLIRDTRDFESELRLLNRHGLVTKDAAIPGGWRVRPQVFLWWIADELMRTVRDETPFEEWLRAQELEGLLTRGEKEQLSKTVRAIVGLLKGGVTTLIEAAAKGAGEAMVKGVGKT